LLARDKEAYTIHVFGAEAHGNYNRILLSSVLAGEKDMGEIMINTPEWYAQHAITLYAGDPVVAIDRKQRTVRSASGVIVSYDRLLLATGSRPFIIPVPGTQLEGVIAFRDIVDVESMLEAARTHRHAVVIGGGLLGLEAANGLLRQGMQVTVVHVADNLMNRQLDQTASQLLKTSLERKGLQVLLNADTAAIVGDTRVTAVRFKDGRELPADIVVMAVGIRPNTDLAREAGLYCEQAIVVDDTMQTLTDPRVYAVGECVQHRKATFGLVAPLWDQARVCAAHLAGCGKSRYRQKAVSTKLKVTGIDLFSAGNFLGGDGSEDLVLRDPRRGIYKRLVLKDNRIVGVVLYGDVQDGNWYFELMQEQRDITAMRSKLLFGRRYCEPSSPAAAQSTHAARRGASA
jgi:nitrite reductase (NADH) large subunit